MLELFSHDSPGRSSFGRKRRANRGLGGSTGTRRDGVWLYRAGGATRVRDFAMREGASSQSETLHGEAECGDCETVSRFRQLRLEQRHLPVELTYTCQRHTRTSARHGSLLEEIAAAYSTSAFQQIFAEVYPKCENISIDYAVLEPRSAKGEMASEIYCLPADFEWNDLGSWDALYEHNRSNDHDQATRANVIESGHSIAIESKGTYVYAPGRTVALLGVEDLVVVVTDDAVLVTTRERSQDVGKVTKALAEGKREDCL